MSKHELIRQGEIYICSLGDNNVGHEQTGDRPCIIIQNNILNITSGLVIVVPLTSRKKKYLPTHYILTKEKYDFLTFDYNVVLCEQMRCLSKKRIGKRIGQLTQEDLEKLLKIKENVFCIV